MRSIPHPKAFTFTEILVAVCILSIALAGMMEMFSAFEVLGDISSKTQLALTEAQAKMEEIEGTTYSSIVANYSLGGSPGNTFSLSSVTGTGTISIVPVTVNSANLLQVTVSVSFMVRNNRVIGASNSPVTITTYISQR